jgi:AbrB family looped-hinge helix DNA binding protein
MQPSIFLSFYQVTTMAQTTVSSKYQVVIPKEIRERTGIKPGQKLSVIATASGVQLVRVPTLAELRGIARGADPSGLREKEDRL